MVSQDSKKKNSKQFRLPKKNHEQESQHLQRAQLQAIIQFTGKQEADGDLAEKKEQFSKNSPDKWVV